MTQRIPQKLHEQVFDSIKDMIRSGALEQGELLPSENKLAQQLGVSRVTVRWALKQLAEAGIIQTRKGKGSIVAVDWKGLLEEGERHDQAEQLQATFFQSTRARWLIEPTVARQAALTAGEEDLARMEEALLRREDELVLAPLTGRVPGRVDFHTSLWACLHNPVMMRVWEELAETSGSINRLPFVAPVYRDGQKVEAQAQHQKIFDAVKSRSPEYAYLYMMEHCDWIWETYGQYFKDFLK